MPVGDDASTARRNEKGRIEPFLYPSQIAKLEEWIALDDASYDGYLGWCDREEIPPAKRWTAVYFRDWKQLKRHGKQIRAIRDKFAVSTELGGKMDRRRRLAALEDDLALVSRRLNTITDDDVDGFVKLSNHKRTLLQAIAQQRGEWGSKMSDEERDGSKPSDMSRNFDRYFASQGKDED